MSLPHPSSGGGSPVTLSAKEQEEWDAPLMALAQKSGGDLRRLQYAFFSFLHRRTDFYMVPNELDVKENVPLKMGFREGDAEKLLLASFRQFPLRRMPRMSAMTPPQQQDRQPRQTTTSSAAPNRSASAAETKDIATVAEKSDTKDETNQQVSNDDEVRYSEDGKQIPVGNGGRSKSKGFRWTQTIHEASIALAVPEGTRGRDLTVTIKAHMVKVQRNADDKQVLLEGTLNNKIRPDESTWTLEGGVLVLSLDKGAKSWWEIIFNEENDQDKVDTTLIDTKRNISEYDDATQGMIRKILFDQRQERLGLPTSDQILNTDKPKIPPLPPGVEYYDKRVNFPPDDYKK